MRNTSTVYKILIILILTLIVFWGGFLRIYRLGEQSLWIDEGYTINAALEILKQGKPMLASGQLYHNMPIITYPSAGIMAIFGFNPFSPSPLRVLPVLFSIATIILVFFFTLSLFKSKPKKPKKHYTINLPTSAVTIALIAAFLTGFSKWAIAWSRQIRGYAPMDFFIILSLFFLWKFFNSGDNKKLIYSGLAFLGAYLSHSLALIMLPAFAVIIFIHLITFKPKDSKGLKSKIRRCILNIKNKISESKKKLPIIITGSFLLFVLTVLGFELLIRISRLELGGNELMFLKFLFNLPAEISTLKGGIGIFSIGAILAAFLGLFDKKHVQALWFLFIPFSLSALLIVQYSPLMNFRYAFILFPIMLILCSYTIFKLAKFIINFKSKIKLLNLKSGISLIVTICIIIFILFYTFPHLNLLPRSHYSLAFGSPQPNFKTVYSIIKNYNLENKKTSENQNIVISPYPHLSKIYLNHKGLWLPISLSGKTKGFGDPKVKKQDPYTGAMAVKSKKQLENLFNTKHGFIMMDAMAINRLRSNAFFIAHHPKTKLIYSSGKGMNKIFLYKF